MKEHTWAMLIFLVSTSIFGALILYFSDTIFKLLRTMSDWIN